MKRALLLIVVLVIAVILVMLLHKPSEPPPVVEEGAVTPPPRVSETETATKVVVDYITALEKGQYRTAYALLSAESKEIHPFDGFVTQAKKGMPGYDLATAQATLNAPEQMTVVARVAEDPASHSFALAREKGAWRILYRTGLPGFPYP